jgi:hypothetical protein
VTTREIQTKNPPQVSFSGLPVEGSFYIIEDKGKIP